MGYTNHITYAAPNPQQAEGVIADIEALIANCDAALDVQRGEGWISLNEVRPREAEFFRWPLTDPDHRWDENRGIYHDHCKTERQGYDAVVLAAMLAVKHHLPETVISSDDAHDPTDLLYDIRDPSSNRGCRSIVELIVKMRWNEFSPQHQGAVALHRRTFPDRDLEALLPWRAVS